MSSYDFIIDGIRFSHSSVSTFETCPYSFKMAYIDALPRENNFFAEYGTLVHECLEKYFKGELEAFELSAYYSNLYDSVIKTPPPPSYVDLYEKYKNQGMTFFDNFSFDKSNYDVLLTEDKIDFELNGVMVTARPDLVLKNKRTGKSSLFDYKTSVPFKEDKRTGKLIPDTKKINGYYKQMFIYTHAVREIKGIPIDSITLWFPRVDSKVEIDWEEEKEKEALDWFLNSVSKIRNEEFFPYNNTNNYFCNNLCGVRKFCEYR